MGAPVLGPGDIERAVFRERFRGYDQDEVDRFLDTVADTIRALTQQRDELQTRLRDTDQRRAEADEAEALLRRTLLAAQRTAESAVAEARREAEQILADARRQAESERDQLREEARLVRQAYEELRRFRADYRSRLHDVVAEQLAILDRVGELSRPPAAVARLLSTGTEPSGTAEVTADTPGASGGPAGA